MTYENVILQKGPVAILTLNRPEARNSLNGPHMHDLMAALREAEADSSVRVVVLKGAGKGFCAGADIGQFLDKSIFEAREHLRVLAEIIEYIANMGKPVIAQVHGFALAGGCGLAVCCDLTYAADDAVFGTPEINIGLWPHTVMAPIFKAIGRKKGLEMMYTGERVAAADAERWGLITRAITADKLEETVGEIAGKMAEKSPVALKLGKEAFYTMSDMEYFKSLRYLREMITLHSNTEDGHEGPRSFKEKRAPVWKGL